MKKTVLNLLLFSIFLSVSFGHGEDRLSFEKIVVSEAFYSEGANFADINGDGQNDIISGPYWYQGPEFTKRHLYGESTGRLPIAGYSNHFLTFTYDFNSDGRVDILNIPFPGAAAHWFENVSGGSSWKKHLAFTEVGGESPAFTDIDGDNKPELIFCFDGGFGFARPDWNSPTEAWKFTPLTENLGFGRFTHGLGIGDVNGDGRPDLLETNGWWEQSTSSQSPFEFHRFPFAESGGAQMFAYDFDGDQDNDILSVQNAHGFGLAWFENINDGSSFQRHDILTDDRSKPGNRVVISQMHAVDLVDMDGDGLKDIVTGKRFWAHGGRDPGAQQLPVLYWFRTVRKEQTVTFEPHLIDARSGVGTQVVAGDLTKDGRPDILVGNKLGTYLFINRAEENNPATKADPRYIAAPGTNLFAAHIRATEALTPEQEVKTFIVPEGFEVSLVASEPDIAKPMNLAFDARGRLWVSSSEEYPFSAPPGRVPKDSIKILEDTTGDGSFDKITTFADGLNIPIGLYPYEDGVICFSIPNIWHLRDRDGDGVADERKVLYGPFDTTRDTHGMINGFRRGFDGWLYACHGFNNHSKVAGADGHSVSMHSGNTFRIRLDGSRIEHVVHGQVNPYGLTLTESGDILTADCHTRPISLLIPGGYHDSFGKPHDGLGFIPNVMQHLHGSTATGGIALSRGTNFPLLYQDSAYGGNVATGRINRNTLVYRGSSISAQEEPDFLISGDPWFRPVDLRVGPDGALYVADFYNRIIGHYEVDLKHPGRDRHRGRIWRIAFVGSNARCDELTKNKPTIGGRSHSKTLEQWIAQLDAPLLNVRQTATDVIVDHFGKSATSSIVGILSHANARVRSAALWILFRLNHLTIQQIESAIQDPSPHARVHGFQLLNEFAAQKQPAGTALLVKAGLADEDAMVRRAAVMAASRNEDDSLIRPLVDLLIATPSHDVHLRYAIRMAIRNHLRNDDWFRRLQREELSPTAKKELASICLGLQTNGAAEYAVKYLSDIKTPELEATKLLMNHVVRIGPVELIPDIVDLAQNRLTDELSVQIELLETLHSALLKREVVSIPRECRDWALRLARQLLEQVEEYKILSWQQFDANGMANSKNPTWQLSTRRNSVDGSKNSRLWSSFPAGERRTGILRSQPFPAPKSFAFFIAGHDGHPGVDRQDKNYVHLRDAVTHKVLMKAVAPRNDIAQRISWDTNKLGGHSVYLELVDLDAGDAYAWLAAGRFSHQGLNPSTSSQQHDDAARIIQKFGLHELRAKMVSLIRNHEVNLDSKASLGRAIASLTSSDGRIQACVEVLSLGHSDVGLLAETVNMIVMPDNALIDDVLRKTLLSANAQEQLQISERLASDAPGANLLLSFAQSGVVSQQILRAPAIRQKLNLVLEESEKDKLDQLLASLPDEDQRLVRLIQDRHQSFLQKNGDSRLGQEVFKQQCSNCHQLRGQGQQVGPNLDGIAGRGLGRLLEDVLYPNRNVDVAFRASTVITEDGKVFHGLIKRTEGTQTILIDSQGKENVIRTDSIEEQHPSPNSPMPSNLSEILTEKQFRDLVAFLLTLRAS